MGQGDSARDFGTSESIKNAGILDVFSIFRTARLGQKIRRIPQSPLCGVALFSQETTAAMQQKTARQAMVSTEQTPEATVKSSSLRPSPGAR